MTQTAVLEHNAQPLHLFKIFAQPKQVASTSGDIALLPSHVKSENSINEWFMQSSMLMPLEIKTITAGKICLSDVVIVRFALSDNYRNHFVLLRGLLEFSRPKNISVSANNSEKSFELYIVKDQTTTVISYVDTILQLLMKEIAFKKSLQAVLKFERSIRIEQSKLYQALRTSIA